MNTHFDDKRGVLVFCRSAKYLQMVQNGAVVTTVLMRKFDSGARSQKLARIDMLELHLFFALPVPTLASHFPVIPGISITISLSKRGNFLLLREWRTFSVRVQVFHSVDVRETNKGSTFNLGQGHSRMVTKQIIICNSDQVRKKKFQNLDFASNKECRCLPFRQVHLGKRSFRDFEVRQDLESTKAYLWWFH